MTIENNDVLLVNRGSTSHKIKYEKIKTDIAGSVPGEAPEDGKQYGRENGTWTEIVHTPEYTDADVNNLLQTNTANAGQSLRWSGSDYYWDTPAEGGGGSAGDISYTYPQGVNRTLQSRLEDYVSVRDFGAVGDGVTDDHAAFQAAITAANTRSVYIPSGTYRLKDSLGTNQALTLFGDGMHSVILYDPDPGTDAVNEGAIGLRVDETEYEKEDGFELRDFQLLCSVRNVCAMGIVIYDGGEDPIQGPWNKAIIENVTIGAYFDPNNPSNPTAGYFKKGLVIANVGGVYANNLTIANNISGQGGGREDPEAYGVYIFVNKNRGSIRQFHLSNFYIQGFYRALFANCSAGSIESIYISQGEVKGREGFIFADRISATYITGIHFDCWRTAVGYYSQNGGVHRCIGCDIRADDEQPWDGYLIQLNSNQIVFSNNFVAVGGGNGAQGGAIACNRVEDPNQPDNNRNENIIVTNNIFEGPNNSNGIALLAQSGTRNLTFGGNVFYQYGNNETPWLNLAGDQMFIYGQRGGNTVV